MERLVEKRISMEIKTTKGAIMYDGWSCNGTHFIAVLACYIVKVIGREDSKEIARDETRMALLALSPMCQEVKNNTNSDDEYEETTTFNAEAHKEFFKQTFQVFDVDFDEWVQCLIGDCLLYTSPSPRDA